MDKVLILGGNRYNILAIQAIKDKDIYTICIDRDENAEAKNYADEFYNIDFSNKEEVYKIAKKKNINAIIPTNDWGVIPSAYASNKLGLLFISESIAEFATNKFLMRQKWQDNGVDMPWFKKIKDLNEIDINALEFPCIFKPQDSKVAGSRGVKVVYFPTEIEEAYKFAKQYSDDILIEELLIGKEHSVEVLIEHGNYHIVAISDKVKTPYPYRVDKEVVYPTSTKGEDLEKLKNSIVKAVKALGLNIGAAHLEICATTDGRYIPFEVGARCGGGGTPNPIVKYVTSIDMMVEFCFILLGRKITFDLGKDKTLNNCVYHFITPEEGIVKKINLTQLESNAKVIDYSVFPKEGSMIKKVKEGPDRAGFVIYKDRTFDSDNIIEVD
jgi:biotin carboxylase